MNRTESAPCHLLDMNNFDSPRRNHLIRFKEVPQKPLINCEIPKTYPKEMKTQMHHTRNLSIYENNPFYPSTDTDKSDNDERKNILCNSSNNLNKISSSQSMQMNCDSSENYDYIEKRQLINSEKPFLIPFNGGSNNNLLQSYHHGSSKSLIQDDINFYNDSISDDYKYESFNLPKKKDYQLVRLVFLPFKLSFLMYLNFFHLFQQVNC
jgi:hypothetical protein